jgi:hypothetical protein
VFIERLREIRMVAEDALHPMGEQRPPRGIHASGSTRFGPDGEIRGQQGFVILEDVDDI